MARKRGSRSSRGKQKLTPVSIIFMEPAEEIRLACVAWMDEMLEMDRQETARREAFIQRIREEQEMRQQRMDESRHARKQNRKRRIAERRAALRREENTVSLDTLKPTGLPVRHHAGCRMINGKIFRIMYPDNEGMRMSIDAVKIRVNERERQRAAQQPSSFDLDQALQATLPKLPANHVLS